MASLQPLTTFSMDGLLQNESFMEALDQAEGVEVVANIVDDTLDRVDRTNPGRNRRNEALSVERAPRLLSRLIELTHFVSEAELLVRSVCELVFNLLQWALMAHHTRNATRILVIQQVWPVESAQIESILISVKEQMEDIKEHFNNAVLAIQQAVSSPSTQQSAQALRRYEAMMSDIQPVFDTCLQYVKQAHATLKTLEPKVESVTRESKKKMVKASVTVTVIAVLAGLAAYYMPYRFPYRGSESATSRSDGRQRGVEGTSYVEIPSELAGVSVSEWFPWGYVMDSYWTMGSAWLLAQLACFGLAMWRRSELLKGLSDYNTQISLIMEVDRMKSQLLRG